ncbi:MAG: hypothetical protein JWN63_3430 [Candidatus Acidoferrum typicum]|nr:hypothetical protein [Candidatus Acidoferrum typicum]
MNDDMLDPGNDPANWDCCDEHETVFWKGTPCPKCEPEPEQQLVGPLGWTVELFVEAGLETCRQQIATKVGEDREGWVKDEWYWIELLKLLRNKSPAADDEPIPHLNQLVPNCQCSGCVRLVQKAPSLVHCFKCNDLVPMAGHDCPAVSGDST